MAVFVPEGLGIGANCEKFVGQEHQMWQQAMTALGARWSHSWGRLDVGPGYLPAVFPEAKGVCPAHELIAWKNRMIARGLQFDQLSWICCNEPENSGKSVDEVIDLVVEQVLEFRRARIRLRLLFPNNNINTWESFRFGVRLVEEARQALTLISPAFHLWCAPQYVPQVWSRYRNWISGYGERLPPVVITEAGPGSMQSMETWLEFMPLAYQLLDDPIVGALAPFAAYRKVRDENGTVVERHPGFISPEGVPNALGQQYIAERQRRYGY